jgi:two-component system, OmpR family, response regulator
MRILVVEDDAALARGLTGFLRAEGWAVDHVEDGETAIAEITGEPYSAVVLDVGLPDIDGFEVLRRLRRGGVRTPVLVLTARDAVQDRIAGLDLGADDYMLKPFELSELAARIRALARRGGGDPAPLLTIGALEVDRSAGRASVGDRVLDLRPREWTVLMALAGSAGQVVDRRVLSGQVFGHDDEVAPNALDVHVGRLRRKLQPDGPDVRTVRGRGFVLEAV